MTTTIVASLLAFLVGLFAGHQTTTDTTVLEIRSEEAEVTDLDTPLPADFLTARPAIAALPDEALTDAEVTDLLFMREEEKLARDVYLTLYDKWGLNIFSNIAQSEQTHTEAVYSLINKYDLTDPVSDDTIGVFTNPDLTALYTDLVEQGSASLVEALKVGALIEDLDINDLQAASARTDNADIALVYGNLERGSRNHLRSFTSQLTARGVTYEPAYITDEEYQTIITSDRETGQGGGMMRGAGAGRGMGRN